MDKTKKARIMLVISAAVFGTIGFFAKNIAVSSGELALYRAILAALLLLIYFAVSGQRIPWCKIKKEIPLLLLSGAAMGINWILLFQAYRYTTVSAATLSYYFAPVIVTAVSPLLFKERIGAKQIVCFAMSTVGLALVIGITDLGKSENGVLGVLLGLSAAVFYSIVILLNKFIRGVSGIQRTFLQFVAAIIVLLPYVMSTSGITLTSLSGTGWIYLLIVGIVHTGVTYCLYFSALKELPGQEVAILSYIDPLVAVIVSVAVLGEPITVLQIIGGVLILGFTLWNEISLKN